jgi:DNA polymerase
MDWTNIQEMPIHHTATIKTSEIPMIVDYCKNDVGSTKRIMELSKDQINLRANLTAEYGVSLYSASEPRISKELFLLFLSKKVGISKYELKQYRTKRDLINIKDILVPYLKFNTPVFQDLLDNFKMVTINAANTKGGFKYSMQYKGVKTDFGLGGVHGARQSGIYKAGDGMIIMSSDVTSFYPNLAIRNGWAPAHLPAKEFCELYEWFFEERKKIPKKDPKNYVFKIILNSTFGLSIDENSFLYDPQFGMQITINGQLTLMMLYEMLAEGIPDCVPLMQNTDGIEMMIPENYKDKYLAICAEWEQITNLQLEHDEYSRLILADVNNYIAVNTAGKYKCKGRFEFENLALHKNKSFLVIPKALFNYFVKDIPPEKSLMENKNILDYCAGVKIKGNWEFHQLCIKKGILTKDVLQKTIRYYISEKGCKIMKVNKSDKREIQLESGKWMQEDLSKFQEKPWSHYFINERYYLDKIYKEIDNICPKQITLF